MKLWLKVTKMSYKCEMKCNWTSAQGHQLSTNLRKTLHSETQTFKETKQQKQSVLQGCQTDRKFIKSKTTKFDPDACKWGWSDDAMNFFWQFASFYSQQTQTNYFSKGCSKLTLQTVASQVNTNLEWNLKPGKRCQS